MKEENISDDGAVETIEGISEGNTMQDALYFFMSNVMRDQCDVEYNKV